MRPLLSALILAATAALPAAGEEAQPGLDRAALHAEIRAYLLENPEILNEMVAILEDRQQEAEAEADKALVAAHADAIFADGFSYVGGNPEGGVTIVEFLDYQCGFCRRAHPELSELIAADGDIRWIVKELPVLGPGSELASRAAIATLLRDGPEGYAALNDRLMQLDGPITDASLDATLVEAGLDAAAIRAGMQDPEITRRIDATRDLAAKLEVAGTPTFVFDDRMLRGYAPSERMQALITEIRAAR
jgi:protein-disulfide isomerase